MAGSVNYLSPPNRRSVKQMQQTLAEIEDGDVWGITFVSRPFGCFFIRGPVRRSLAIGALTLGGKILTTGDSVRPVRQVVRMTTDLPPWDAESAQVQAELFHHGTPVVARFDSFGDILTVAGYLVESTERKMLGVGHHIVSAGGRISASLLHISALIPSEPIWPCPEAVGSWSAFDDVITT